MPCAAALLIITDSDLSPVPTPTGTDLLNRTALALLLPWTAVAVTGRKRTRMTTMSPTLSRTLTMLLPNELRACSPRL